MYLSPLHCVCDRGEARDKLGASTALPSIQPRSSTGVGNYQKLNIIVPPVRRIAPPPSSTAAQVSLLSYLCLVRWPIRHYRHSTQVKDGAGVRSQVQFGISI